MLTRSWFTAMLLTPLTIVIGDGLSDSETTRFGVPVATNRAFDTVPPASTTPVDVLVPVWAFTVTVPPAAGMIPPKSSGVTLIIATGPSTMVLSVPGPVPACTGPATAAAINAADPAALQENHVPTLPRYRSGVTKSLEIQVNETLRLSSRSAAPPISTKRRSQ